MPARPPGRAKPWKVRRSDSGRRSQGAVGSRKWSPVASSPVSTLCTCTWAPAGMSIEARPMNCPYLRIGVPFASGRSASLCAAGMALGKVSSPALSPASRRRRATATSSSGWRRIRASAAVRLMVIGSKTALDRPGLPDCLLPGWGAGLPDSWTRGYNHPVRPAEAREGFRALNRSSVGQRGHFQHA